MEPLQSWIDDLEWRLALYLIDTPEAPEIKTVDVIQISGSDDWIVRVNDLIVAAFSGNDAHKMAMAKAGEILKDLG